MLDINPEPFNAEYFLRRNEEALNPAHIPTFPSQEELNKTAKVSKGFFQRLMNFFSPLFGDPKPLDGRVSTRAPESTPKASTSRFMRIFHKMFGAGKTAEKLEQKALIASLNKRHQDLLSQFQVIKQWLPILPKESNATFSQIEQNLTKIQLILTSSDITKPAVSNNLTYAFDDVISTLQNLTNQIIEQSKLLEEQAIPSADGLGASKTEALVAQSNSSHAGSPLLVVQLTISRESPPLEEQDSDNDSIYEDAQSHLDVDIEDDLTGNIPEAPVLSKEEDELARLFSEEFVVPSTSDSDSAQDSEPGSPVSARRHTPTGFDSGVQLPPSEETEDSHSEGSHLANAEMERIYNAQEVEASPIQSAYKELTGYLQGAFKIKFLEDTASKRISLDDQMDYTEKVGTFAAIALDKLFPPIDLMEQIESREEGTITHFTITLKHPLVATIPNVGEGGWKSILRSSLETEKVIEISIDTSKGALTIKKGVTGKYDTKSWLTGVVSANISVLSISTLTNIPDETDLNEVEKPYVRPVLNMTVKKLGMSISDNWSIPQLEKTFETVEWKPRS